ncbi:MAG TPA: hypothetical protein VGB75_01330 [Jatrophihabitans sp.]|jgi:hypothetical protein|uniref:hypothetical protein n=1 Tax=Jatrophihabitans sp. TaxID=1932789 RepID=UPI002F1B1367
MTSHADNLAIKSAAAALFRAAATSVTELDNGTRLLCLAAFEHLNPPSPPATVPTENADVEALIRAALRLLATLPSQEFDKTAILDAAAAGRRALLHLG